MAWSGAGQGRLVAVAWYGKLRCDVGRRVGAGGNCHGMASHGGMVRVVPIRAVAACRSGLVREDAL